MRPRADRRGAGAHQAPSVRCAARRVTTRARQRHVAPPRARPGHGGRRAGRAQDRPAAARAPQRGAPGRARSPAPTARRRRRGCSRWRSARTGDAVVSNETGSNMPPGHVAALAGTAGTAGRARDGRDLPAAVLTATSAAAVVLLNLSRDQLDRTQRGPHGGRPLAGRAGGRTAHRRRRQRRRSARGVGCRRRARRALGRRRPALAARCRRAAPSCEGRIAFGAERLGLRQRAASPGPTRRRRSTSGRTAPPECGWADGRTPPAARWRCPAASTRPMPLMAAVAAEACGIDAPRPLAAMATVEEVAGRFTVRSFGAVRARLMLAKNPAGWDELLDLVAGSDAPLVVSINARIGRRRRPELAVGRALRAPGRSCRGGHRRPLPRPLGAPALRRRRPTSPSPIRSVRSTRRGGEALAPHRADEVVDVIGNYTAFHDLLGHAAMSAAAHRGRLPRPARHLRRRRERPDPGPARPSGAATTSSCCRPPSDRPLPEADVYCLGGGEDGPQVQRRPDAHRRRHAGPAGGRRAPSCWRSAPGSRSSGRTFPGRGGEPHEGVGLLDVETRQGRPGRARWARSWPRLDAPDLLGTAARR